MSDDAMFMIGGLLRVPLEHILERVLVCLAEADFAGLNANDFFVFAHLRRTDGMRLVDLAKQNRMSKQAMLYVVNRLIEHGYLARRLDPVDKRAQLLHLTPLGLQVVKTAREVMEQIDGEFARIVGRRSFEELKRNLLHIVQVLERRD